MSRSFGAVNFVALIFVVTLLYGYYSYVQKEKEEIERLKLAYAIDYAADAGASAMLLTEELDMDYAQNLVFTIDPQLALDTFLAVMCFNYGLYPDAANVMLMKNYVPVAAVAAIDGFYIASHEQVATRDDKSNSPYYDLVFGMKLPYRYQEGNATYALQMGWNGAYRLTPTELSRLEHLPEIGGVPMTMKQVMALITDTISNEMAYRIQKQNETNPHWQNFFYIPGQLSASGVNAVEGPSLLVLVQNMNLTTARPISGFSVSGSSIQTANMIAGYTRNGAKLYTYPHLVPPGVTVENLFESQDAAARQGYYPDLSNLR